MFMVRKNKRTEKNWRYIFYSGFITALILCLFYVAPDRAFAEETKILKTQDYVYQYNKKYKGIEKSKRKGIYMCSGYCHQAFDQGGDYTRYVCCC